MSTQRDKRPLVGVGVVFIRRGRVFLARRRGSHGAAAWASAGGHLEYGETPEQCARREAAEELGVTVGELRILCVSNILAYDRHYVDIEFLGDIWRPGTRSRRRRRFLWRIRLVRSGCACRSRCLNRCAWPCIACLRGNGITWRRRSPPGRMRRLPPESRNSDRPAVADGTPFCYNGDGVAAQSLKLRQYAAEPGPRPALASPRRATTRRPTTV